MMLHQYFCWVSFLNGELFPISHWQWENLRILSNGKLLFFIGEELPGPTVFYLWAPNSTILNWLLKSSKMMGIFSFFAYPPNNGKAESLFYVAKRILEKVKKGGYHPGPSEHPFTGFGSRTNCIERLSFPLAISEGNNREAALMTENKLQDQCYNWSVKDLAGDSEWNPPMEENKVWCQLSARSFEMVIPKRDVLKQ